MKKITTREELTAMVAAGQLVEHHTATRRGTSCGHPARLVVSLAVARSLRGTQKAAAIATARK